MHQTLRRNAAGRAAVSAACTASFATGAGLHGYLHTAWVIPAVARPKWAITPVDARPTRRGAPPH